MLRSSTIVVVGVLLWLPALGTDELTEHRGQRVIFEFPDLDDFGTRLRVPDGWQYVQVGAKNFDRLLTRFGVSEIPALVFIDPHGNPLHRIQGAGVRDRLRDGVQTFERHQRELEARIGRLAREARDAREARKPGREVQRVVELARLGVQGYEAIATARQRRAELDAEQRAELLRIMSHEGLDSTRKLLGRLKDLGELAEGLPVAKAIQRHRVRLENGVTVQRNAR